MMMTATAGPTSMGQQPTSPGTWQPPPDAESDVMNSIWVRAAVTPKGPKVMTTSKTLETVRPGGAVSPGQRSAGQQVVPEGGGELKPSRGSLLMSTLSSGAAQAGVPTASNMGASRGPAGSQELLPAQLSSHKPARRSQSRNARAVTEPPSGVQGPGNLVSQRSIPHRNIRRASLLLLQQQQLLPGGASSGSRCVQCMQIRCAATASTHDPVLMNAKHTA
jgi:hypothetical protein